MRKIVNALVILTLCLGLGGCSRSNLHRYTVVGTFDTVIEVLCAEKTEAERHGKIAEERLKYWHRLCDAYHPYATGGGIYRINHSDGRWVEISDDLKGLLEFGLEAYRQTDGAVNMMCGSVTALWKDATEPPSADRLHQAMQHIDISVLELDGNRVRLTDPQARLDVGAFAKGYALQRTVTVMKEQFGFRGMISAVSSVIVVGDKDGQPYRVGIGDQKGGIAAELRLTDMALSTSGTDQRFFTYQGKTYHHIIDLQTGQPADAGVTQASVLHTDAGWADVYSTAALITGKPYGDTLLRKNGNNEYYGKIKEWL